MLELSDWEFEMTMITVLRDLMDNVDSVQEQIGNIKQKEGNPKKEPKRNTQDKNTIIEMMNVFDGLISRLNIAEERNSEPEDVSIEFPKVKSQDKEFNKSKKQKRNKRKKPEHPRTVGQLQKT